MNSDSSPRRSSIREQAETDPGKDIDQFATLLAKLERDNHLAEDIKSTIAKENISQLKSSLLKHIESTNWMYCK